MCRIEELCRKDVINVQDGCCLGNVCDVEIDVINGCVTAIVIYGRNRFFGLFGRCEDIIVPWCNIQKIGQDTILVSYECAFRHRPKSRGFMGFFK